MMISLLGSLVGLLGSFVPEIFKLTQDKRDKEHELKIMELQMEQQAAGASQKLEEIMVQSAAAETVAMQQSYRSELKYFGKFAASVRPVVTYLFVAEYIAIKFALLYTMTHGVTALPWATETSAVSALASAIPMVWGEADMGLFSGIIAFWFGGRALEKNRR